MWKRGALLLRMGRLAMGERLREWTLAVLRGLVALVGGLREGRASLTRGFGGGV